jgi:hypothetical protein
VSDDQRDRLEEEEGDAERLQGTDIGRAAEHRDERQEGESDGERAIDDQLVRAEAERSDDHAR